MWAKSYDAAALKSVVLDMKRWLPLTPQLAAATAADGQVVDVRDLDADQPELPTGSRDDEPDEDAQWVAEARGEEAKP
jgi:recombinational DNA repair protein RecT